MALAEAEFTGTSNAFGIGISESVGGAAAIVLTILGLAHVVPVFLVAIALIAAGAAQIIRGVLLIRDYDHALERPNAAVSLAELGGAGVLPLEVLAGGSAIILGILALLQLDPVDLVAIGVIALGSALVLTTNATARIGLFKVSAIYRDERGQRLAGEVMAGTAMLQALSGLTAVVLGIIALAGFSSLVLILIALLNLGGFIVLNGATVGETILAIFRRA